MAYLIGIVTKKEAAALKKRGWTLEDLKAGKLDCLDEIFRTMDRASRAGGKAVMVFVDNDLAKIMDGPDWDKEETPAPKRKRKASKPRQPDPWIENAFKKEKPRGKD